MKISFMKLLEDVHGWFSNYSENVPNWEKKIFRKKPFVRILVGMCNEVLLEIFVEIIRWISERSPREITREISEAN